MDSPNPGRSHAQVVTRAPGDNAHATDGRAGDTGADSSPRIRRARGRWVAALLGLFAALCAIAVPLLPVVQDTARIEWPNAGDTRPVNSPLVAYWAQDLQVSLPCETIRSLDARTPEGPSVLFATVPPVRAEYGAGMQLDVESGRLTVVNRGQRLVQQDLPSSDCSVGIASDVSGTKVTVAGQPIVNQRSDVRPRVTGIYSDIDGRDDPTAGLGVTITPDTRYQSSPTTLKIVVGILGILFLLGSLFALYRLDAQVARRAPRWAPVGWWRPTLPDLTVFGVLGAWVVIGPGTSDDGYILVMSRVAEDAGYLTNYYRWLGVAEAPFGWFYHLFEAMAQVSTATPWMRLPAFVLGMVSWVLISREVLPRLGKEVRNSRAAFWAAAAVLLVWWLPFNNGLRPEPVAAVGSLLALCAVERALVTRRLLPMCLGLITAALTLAATPTGLIAVAPFLVAARPLFKLLASRAKEGWAPIVGPILGSGLMVLVVIFADQTVASIVEATRVRTLIGPSLSWFEEFSRYQLLFSASADGSVTRRFPVLLLLLCTATCIVVLLRRGRIPGAALGPSRRLIGTVGLSLPLIALTPTKWTHHFGAFAPLGAALAALTALAASSTVLRSARNRLTFTSGLLVVAALAATGPNAFWYVSTFGVPWFDKSPSVRGIQLSTILLLVAMVFAVIAFVQNVRMDRPGAPAHVQERRARGLILGSAPLVIICGLVVMAEFGSMAKAMHKQRDSYSVGTANAQQIFEGSCSLSDKVLVERDATASVLKPALPLDVSEKGFHREPVDRDDPLSRPPSGFDRKIVPMWSSYRDEKAPTGTLRTEWYELPADALTGEIVVSRAGPVFKGGRGIATTLTAEFGRRDGAGVKTVKEIKVVVPQGNASSSDWFDMRIDLTDQVPPNTDLMRLVAEDDDLTEDGWIAITSPRVSRLTTLTERVGDQPVFMDWPVSFAFPCQRPPKIRDGILEIPAFRIMGGTLADGAPWSNDQAGGPLGLVSEMANQLQVPSLLEGDPFRQWGQVLRVQPYVNGVEPNVIRGEEVRQAWWSIPGPTLSTKEG